MYGDVVDEWTRQHPSCVHEVSGNLCSTNVEMTSLGVTHSYRESGMSVFILRGAACFAPFCHGPT